MVDWNDNKKRKEFRLALQRVYPNPADLRIFVDEELAENLATIASDNNLQETAHGLVAWAKAKGRLDEVFVAFCHENPNDPVIAALQQRTLINRPSNLRDEDWEILFEQFSPYDLADIQRAFLRGFQQALNVVFQQVRPDRSPLTEQAQIQELLATYDDPKLAVRFVESAIAEIQCSSEGSGRDLTGLQQWRDRVAQQYNVPPLASEPVQTMVDWNDNKKRKEFRLALQRAYPNPADLRIFVDEALAEDLAGIVDCGADRAVIAYGLVEWARAKGRLDELYEAFNHRNWSHPLIIKELEEQSEKQAVVIWQNKKRKAFQEALQNRYPSYKELEIFVDYELSERLADIAPNDNLSNVTYELLKWFDVRHRLDEVYEAFKRENQNHPLIEELERSAEK